MNMICRAGVVLLFATTAVVLPGKAQDTTVLATFGPFTDSGSQFGSDLNAEIDFSFFIAEGTTLSPRGAVFSVSLTPGETPFETVLTQGDGPDFDEAVAFLTDDQPSILASALSEISSEFGTEGGSLTTRSEDAIVLSPGIDELQADELVEIALIVTGLETTATTRPRLDLDIDLSASPSGPVLIDTPAVAFDVTYRIELRGIPEPAAAFALAGLGLCGLRRRVSV
ncbi:MAG: PEP-CTERM sorting domain-containing protein [Planctomycetota bacterium]